MRETVIEIIFIGFGFSLGYFGPHIINWIIHRVEKSRGKSKYHKGDCFNCQHITGLLCDGYITCAVKGDVETEPLECDTYKTYEE